MRAVEPIRRSKFSVAKSWGRSVLAVAVVVFLAPQALADYPKRLELHSGAVLIHPMRPDLFSARRALTLPFQTQMVPGTVTGADPGGRVLPINRWWNVPDPYGNVRGMGGLLGMPRRVVFLAGHGNGTSGMQFVMGAPLSELSDLKPDVLRAVAGELVGTSRSRPGPLRPGDALCLSSCNVAFSEQPPVLALAIDEQLRRVHGDGRFRPPTVLAPSGFSASAINAIELFDYYPGHGGVVPQLEWVGFTVERAVHHAADLDFAVVADLARAGRWTELQAMPAFLELAPLVESPRVPGVGPGFFTRMIRVFRGARG